MRIQSNFNGEIGRKFSFKSLRTDKNTLTQLKNGEKPLIENNKQNIYAALNNVGGQTDRKSIEFLLDLADNLTYGQNGESEFKKILDLDANTPTQRENTDWSKLLADTIKRALNASGDKTEDLEQEYERIFLNSKPLTDEQKQILELRRQLTDKICSETSVEDVDSLIISANIRKNLDYFISSSEISFKQKRECLEKFLYLLSDDYKINPQLSDKKPRVLDEMLNDLLVKSPESEILTTKEIDQKYSGMCAAISICRKAMAYEDKTGYVNLILEELKDSPVMEVFDVTELGTGKKVSIPKTDIDYDTALEKGYRIVDASAHNWMHNAHASGDGTIQTEWYSAFDKDSYGIYDDTSWYENLDVENHEEKDLLKALIKEKESLLSLQRTKNRIKSAHLNIIYAKKDTIETQSKISAVLRNVLCEVFPNKSDKEIIKLEKGLYEFYSGTKDNNEVNVPSQLPVSQKQSRLEKYIKDINPQITAKESEVLSQNSDKIYRMVDEYTILDKNLKKLHRFDTGRGKFDYYKKLYNLAAAHRLAMEADVNMQDGVVRFEKISGLKERETQILNYLQTIERNAKSEVMQNLFIDNIQGDKTAENLSKSVIKDMYLIDTQIPAQVDNILKSLYGMNTAQLVEKMYENVYSTVKDGKSDKIQTIASMLNVSNDKMSVLDELQKWQTKLKFSPSKQVRNEAIRLLGYQDSMHFASSFINTFINSLQNGITQETYDFLSKQFGGEENIAEGVSNQRDKFLKLASMQEEIVEKWQIPSPRILILEKLEKAGNILTRNQLNILQAKFDYIQSQKRKNSQIKSVKEREKADKKLYVFSDEEIAILNKIEKSIPQMKKYCTLEYQAMNKGLKEELDKQYSDIGMLNGQFWVREEGSTGLTSNEQIRIFEQMTGRPYHMVYDIKEAAKQIAKGEGSGVISMSVSDSDYAFHAQYIPFVSGLNENRTDIPDDNSGIVWTDNSWGRIEKDYYWEDENGIEHTDYGSGYGWKDGFIIDDAYRIGLPLKDIAGAVGLHKENPVSKQDVPDETESFGLFTDVVLPGIPVDAYQKLYKMFNNICTMQGAERVYETLEEKLKSGSKLNLDLLVGIDETASAIEDEIYKRLDREIKTKEDYDKLDENDSLKFIMDKFALYMSTDNPAWADNVLSALTRDDLDKRYKEIQDEHINVLLTILGKSDDNIAVIEEAARPKFENLFNQLEKDLSIQIPKEDKEQLIKYIIYDEEGVFEVDGSISSMENFYLNKIAEGACDYLDDEKAARYFIPRAQKIIKEVFDNNIRISSLDSPLIDNSPLRDEFLSIIDKYFNPASDEEMLKVIQGLQEADDDTVDKLFDLLTDEEIGIYIKPAYDYILKYKEGNMDVIRELSSVITSGIIYSELNLSKDDDENETPDELFRTLLIRLSDLDVQKYIKAFKAEAFQKYQVRQAFPNPVVLKDEKIEDVVFSMFESLKEDVLNIKGGNYYINMFENYEDFERKTSNTELMKDINQNKNKLLKDENPEEIEQMKQSLQVLLDCIGEADDEFKGLIKAVNAIMHKLQNEDENTTCFELSKDIKAMRKIVSDWEKSSFTKERFIQVNKDTLNQIRYKIKLLVNTNVEEKYRNDVYNKLNKLVVLYKKDADEKVIKQLENEISENITDKHIVKNPVKLLVECVKDVQNGDIEKDDYQVRKTYLQEALQVALQTRVQYKLVQNQHESIGSKLKDMLEMFHVTLSDGRTLPMSDTVGLVYLVEQLKNSNDDNKTLNLFLQQSGLSQGALEALISTFDINQSKDFVDEKCKNIKLNLKEFKKVNDEITKYINSSKIKYKSFPEITEQLGKYMKRKFALKNNNIAKQYIDYLNSIQFEDTHYNIAPSMILTYFNAVNDDILQAILEENINVGIDYIDKLSQMLSDRMMLLYTIDVPNDSEVSKEREEFRQKYEDTQLYISQKFDDIKQTAYKNNVLAFK